MSLRYAFSLILIGVAVFAISFRMTGQNPWITAISVYFGISLIWVGAGYAGFGSSVFGKRSDGRLRTMFVMVLAPYHLINCLGWYLSLILSREPAAAELESNLWFGRRLVRRDLKRVDLPKFVGCLDLTAEFSELNDLRQLRFYRCAPILDGTAPTENQLDELTTWLSEAVKTGPIFVHCAVGHGRTGTILLAYLMRFRRVETATDGLKRLRQSRPHTGINADQLAALEKFAKTIGHGRD